MRRQRVLLAGCLMVTMAVGITACSGSTTSTTTGAPGAHADPLTRVRASVAATEAAGSAHFVTATTTQSVTGSIPSTVQRTAATGDVDFVGPDIELATGTQLPDTPHPPVTRVLRIGDSVYVSTAPTGIRWVRSYTLAKNVNYLGAVTAASLVDTKGPVGVLGTTTIDGRPAIEFAVAMPGGTSTQSGSGIGIQHITVAPFVAHVWLDGRGRIVQTSATVVVTDIPPPASLGSSPVPYTYSSTSTATLSKFGEPVHLSRPTGAG